MSLRYVFRHDGIVGAGFLGGILREDTELSVFEQLKGAAAAQASLRLRQIDDRAGYTVLGTVGGLVLIPGAVAEGDIGAVGQQQLQIDAGSIQGGQIQMVEQNQRQRPTLKPRKIQKIILGTRSIQKNAVIV